MLGLGLLRRSGATLVSANAELTSAGPDHVTFGSGLGPQTVVHLRATGGVDSHADLRAVGDLTTVTAAAGAPLTIRFAAT